VHRYLQTERQLEYVFRTAIVGRFLTGKQAAKGARIYFEFRAGNSKLDALVVDSSSHAVEIKTEFDELRRLSTQLEAYRERFVSVWVFCSPKHIEKVGAMEDSVGIATLGRSGSFEVYRPARRAWGKLNSVRILESLRRSEYLSILEAHGFESLGIPNTKIHSAAMRYAEGIDPRKIHKGMLGVLKARAGQLRRADLIRLPRELRAAALLSGLSPEESGRLAENVTREF
jgi:hypothetical protein